MAKVTETEFIEEKIKDIIGAMEALLAASKSRPGSVIAELLARAEMPSVIDGYGTGNRGEPTSGGDVGDPVHGTVVARAADVCGKCVGTGYVFKKQGRNPKKFSCPQCRGSGRRWADPVSDAVVSIRDCVTRIHVECKSIDKSRSRIGATVPNASGSPPSRATAWCGDGGDRGGREQAQERPRPRVLPGLDQLGDRAQHR